MSKVIKEIMMMLLTCLVGILLFAVIFYQYIPSRKNVAEVVKYTPSDQVSEAKADDVDKRNDQVVLTYQVTSTDLNNYKYKKEYVPGKANPFAMVSQDAESTATTNKSGGNSSSSNQSGSSSTSSSSTTKETTKSLIDDNGTK